MPIYEYICNDCNPSFEMLMQAGREPVCPTCEGESLRRKLSVFAVSRNFSSAGENQPCGTCGDTRGPGPAAQINFFITSYS